ncbi:MAG: hypothetical protein Q9166_007103 [cf. Caloplaca sp. 2 TL-2023]
MASDSAAFPSLPDLRGCWNLTSGVPDTHSEATRLDQHRLTDLSLVVVRLIPQDKDGECTRVITLEPSYKSVYIGRASKTPSKGLIAAPENAWFDSPIMSRTHGKMFLTDTGVVQLKDLGSTHGTFHRLKRLAATETCELRDGDRVTFGSTITSGPVTYHARNFTVELSATCGQQEPQSSSSSKSSVKSGFRVPEVDSGSLSSDSEDDDCEILDSHPRTFSVPSSGDEQDASDDDGPAVYTSRGIGSFPGDPQKYGRRSTFEDSWSQLDNQGQRPSTESQAGSALDPIEVDKVPRKIDNVIDDTEDEGPEDEGPDEEPIHLGRQKNADISKATNLASSEVDSSDLYTEIPDTYASCDPSKKGCHISQVGAVARGQYDVSASAIHPQVDLGGSELSQTEEVQKNHSYLPSTSNEVTTPFDSNNERATEASYGHNVVHDEPAVAPKPGQSEVNDLQSSPEPEQEEEDEEAIHSPNVKPTVCPEPEELQSSGSRSPDARQAQEYMSDDEAKIDGLGPFMDPTPPLKDPMPAMTFDADDTWPPVPPPSFYPPPGLSFVPRFPVQPEAQISSGFRPPPRRSQPQMTSFQGLAAPKPFWRETPSKADRAPSPSDAALARKAPAIQAKFQNSFSFDDPIEGWPYQAAQPAGRPEIDPNCKHFPQLGFGTASSTSWHLTHSTAPFYDAQTSHGWASDRFRGTGIEQAEPSDYQQGPFSKRYESFHPAASALTANHKSPSPSPQKRCHVRLKVDPKTVDEQSISPNVDSVKSRKVDISNLVDSHGDGARGLKRKSDQMSHEGSLNKIFDAASQSSFAQQVSEDDFGPHAQARDPAFSVDENISQELASDLTELPSNVVVSATGEGPARKKPRMSSLKAGAVGKFVSGICIGLAGAFAAFVAAAPTDVWDEALREAVKLT